MEKVLVNDIYLLRKFPGKGGWIFAEIPEVLMDKKNPFGWVKVKGSIDNYNFNNYRLMPMGNGNLFMPVRSEIRKKIGKSEGDLVHIILMEDHEPPVIPEELLICLEVYPELQRKFVKYSDGKQKSIIDWIFSAKTDRKKVERIAKTIEKLEEE